MSRTPISTVNKQQKMVFASSKQMLGTPNFKIVDIDPTEIAKSLQLYLERGSKLTGVSLDDINTSLSKPVSDQSNVTLAELLDCGMKLFDALVWLSAGRPETHPLVTDRGTKTTDIPSMHDVARSVFYVYFFLLTQARYPAGSKSSEKPKVPNFLKVIMGMNDEQHIYVDKICSFEPQKFDPAWIKFVNFNNFGQESLSRFGLGVAGYRLFGPFKLYTPKVGINDQLLRAATFAKNVAIATPSWDVHPSTRNPSVLTKRGNLNKNLGNLILDVFTDEQITEMVETKVLFKRPEKLAGYKNYLQWGIDDDISGGKPIFRVQQ